MAGCKSDKDRDEQVTRKLEKAYPRLKDKLLKPEPRELPGISNVLVGYITFLDWMKVYDCWLKRDMGVNVNSYLSQKKRHEEETFRLLAAIRNNTDTGTALLDELDDAPFSLLILPFFRWDHYSARAETVVALEDEAKATEEGKPVLDDSGNPVKGAGVGTGKGAHSAIWYSAYMWGSYRELAGDVSVGTGRWSGPGTQPDEGLFHEMVHASRNMRGVRYKSRVSAGYDNAEEFLAVVLTNIYISEKTRGMDLRRDHATHLRLERPEAFLDNPQQVDPSPRDLLERFRRNCFRKGSAFFDALAAITDAPFNPVRQYARELKRKGARP